VSEGAGPLSGRRVAVTRPREQSGALAEALVRLGAAVIEAPAIELVDPPDWQPLDEALLRLTTFDWIVWTSANALPRLRARLAALGLDPDLIGRLPARHLAVGPATGRELAAVGIAHEALGSDFRAEGIVEHLAREPLEGRTVWLPRALEGRDLLPKALHDRGAEVVVTPVYASRPWPLGVAPARAAIADGTLDAVTFTSGAIAGPTLPTPHPISSTTSSGPRPTC